MRSVRRILVITPNDAPASVCEMGIRSALREHPGWVLRRRIGWPSSAPAIKALRAWKPDGILTLLSSPPFHFPDSEPVVVGLRNYECPVMIHFDEHRVGALAAETLIGLGYSTLYGLWLPKAADDTLWFRPRHEGFMRRCSELGVVARNLIPTDPNHRVAVDLLADALSNAKPGRRPFAVFCGNDYFANCATSACAKLGLRVPDDVALIGADDLPGHEAERLGLTSVRIPHFEIGQEGVRVMNRIFAGHPDSRHAYVMPVSTVSRRTSTREVQIEDALVRSALAFIDAHIGMPLGIDQIAKAIGASRRTLTDRFRDALGSSVKHAIDRRRVGHAIALLQAGTHGIPEAAAAIGCDDAGNFARLVTRVTGKSPKHHLPKR